MPSSTSPTPPPDPSRPAAPDPFDLLGLEPVFDLDPERVRRAFLARSARIHPDAASDADPDLDSPLLAGFNRAKAILLDPEQRADALLLRLGGPARDAQRSLPPGFLAEMMDARERMDAEINDPAARERWRAWAAARRRESIDNASRAFREAAAVPLNDPERPRHLTDIRRGLNAWRYFERMLEQIDPHAPPNPAP